MRSRWAAVGAAVAVALGAGGVSWVGATISSGARSVFVPITPCRLVDTRPTTPLGAASTTSYKVHGTNGACTIPAGATAISGNATITDPTDDGFMTLAPKGGIGTASNLNWLRGQSPTPNSFTVALSGDGFIDVYNDRGTVNVIIDINGYYEDHDHDDRYYTKVQSDAALATKANAADVYTKTEIDNSAMNTIIAAGRVNSDGSTNASYFSFGSFTTSKVGTGNYSIIVQGLMPGCAGRIGLIEVSRPLFSPGEIGGDLTSIACVSGNTNFQVTPQNSSGVATDSAFTFVVYADKPTAGLTPAAEGNPSECRIDADGNMSCT
jgi:hypothetical protein